MKSPSIILITAVVLFGGGIGAYTLLNRNILPTEPHSTEKTDLVPNQDTVLPRNQETALKKEPVRENSPSGTYTPFTPEVLASSTETRRVLFFYANWCPTCKPADESFAQKTAQLPPDVTVIRVNYNDNQTDQAEKDLAKKYGVTYQHTFVQIDANGNEVTKWNGGHLEELLQNIK